MRDALYTLGNAHGPCLSLIKKLQQVTGMIGSDCIRIGQKLFMGHYSRENPVTVDVPDSRSAEDLEALLCRIWHHG